MKTEWTDHQINKCVFAFCAIVTGVCIFAVAKAKGDDNSRSRFRRHEPNWIIERQLNYQVQGVPTSRIIVGKREIDIYPNGLMFEKGNVVGVKK